MSDLHAQLQELVGQVEAAQRALETDSNDAEHDALVSLIRATTDLLDSQGFPVPGWNDLGVLDDAGEVGGDEQAGPSYGRTYTYGPVNGRWLVISEYYFPILVETHEDDPRNGTFSWDEQTMFTICTDLDDPGGTEISSDVTIGPGGALVYGTMERASEEARQASQMSSLRDYEFYDPTSDLERGLVGR